MDMLDIFEFISNNNINIIAIYSSKDQLSKYLADYLILKIDQSVYDSDNLDSFISQIDTSKKYIIILTQYFNDYSKNFTKAEQEDIISKLFLSSDKSICLAVPLSLVESRLSFTTISKECSFIINFDAVLQYETNTSV